jgi:hypothetical protein
MNRRRIGPAAAVIALSLALIAVRASGASAALRLVPGSFEAYVSNSADPSNPWVGDPTDLDTTAGSHPLMATTSFEFEWTESPFGLREAGGNVKDIEVNLPAGFIGNPTAMPACPASALEHAGNETSCPTNTQVGTALVSTGHEPEPNPVYNMEAPPNEPARFGMVPNNSGHPVYITLNVRSNGDYGVVARLENIPEALDVISTQLTLWGEPSDPSHDPQRVGAGGVFGAPSGLPVRPFLTNPTNCEVASPTTIFTFDSWQEPGAMQTATAVSPSVDRCSLLSIDPKLRLSPVTSAADAPTAAQTVIEAPQSEAAGALGTPPLRNVTVALPKGLTISPSAANGLGACTEAQLGYGTLGPTACPNDSKIGSATVHTPLLKKPLTGAAYVGAPLSSDPASGQMYRLFLSFEGSGVKVKLIGQVHADPETGQLTAVFQENPQLPFEELDLDFFGGPGAALATPPSCGSFASQTLITSWGGQSEGGSSPFSIGECPNAGRFSPGLEAGTQNPQAAESSPLTFRLTRKDGELEPSGVELKLPEGLTASLARVPYCPDGALAAASGRSAAAELASPSCPTASKIGAALVGAGPGSSPFYVNGSVYLAGPYKGAPLSVAVIVPAKAGPFDLGTVVVRSAVFVNQETTELDVRSDPLPQILGGVPLRLRDVRLSIDRPSFTRNPTSCKAKQIGASILGQPSITGAGAGTPTTSTPSAAFEAANCEALLFAPKLSLRVFGKTNRNAKPRLRAVLQAKPGEANIARAQVNLPHSEFLEQNHIKTVCTRVQWAEGNGNGSTCPKGSIYGKAKAWTPLLEKPLEGYVYLRSNGGERKLPDLVAALNGQVDIALWGKVDSGPNHGIRNTFEVVPDAPVTKFILEMKGGGKGLLVNSESLCSPKAKTHAIVRLTGQNGKVHAFKPKVANSCGRGKAGGDGK